MNGMDSFSIADVSDLTGKLAVITGSNSGTGYETALVLAGKGAEVVLAARNAEKAEAAKQRILKKYPNASVRFEALNLASQASVTAFSERILGHGQAIDILINNAGLMALPKRHETVDGFEMQMATNYFGHFALTTRLLPLLKAGHARVVQMASIAHRNATIRLGDLNHVEGYKPWPVYGQTKLAMLMFALELDRRSNAKGWGLTSVAAHPGFARTELMANGPLSEGSGGLMMAVAKLVTPYISQSAADGALPSLMAATAPDINGGAYLGPQGFQEMKGRPGPAKIAEQALDADVASRLWSESERLTHLTFG